jgi:hypothetical protein
MVLLVMTLMLAHWEIHVSVELVNLEIQRIALISHNVNLLDLAVVLLDNALTPTNLLEFLAMILTLVLSETLVMGTEIVLQVLPNTVHQTQIVKTLEHAILQLVTALLFSSQIQQAATTIILALKQILV